jgi:uncharacterized protein
MGRAQTQPNLPASPRVLQHSGMKFSESDNADGLTIRAYQPGALVIGEGRFTHSVLLTPQRVSEWPPADIPALDASHFQPVLALQPELVILGTGVKQVFPPPRTYAALMAAGIGIEIMDTGAACRTYNILMAEGRRVAAALIVA